MHPSFESLVVTCAPGLQASLMHIHHDTSLKSLLEDDSISSTSKVHICYCSSRGVGLWLIVRPSIRSFHITHSAFFSMLCFHFDLIYPSTSSLFTCECGHRLDAFGTHLVHCPFGGQWITTHDTIQDIMYALARKSGHVVWK